MPARRYLNIVLTLVVSAQLCSAQALCLAQTLHTTDGIWSNASLSNLEGTSWSFKTNKGVIVASEDICRWGSWRGIRGKQAVWLSDGSWICGAVTMQATGNVSIQNDWLDCPEIPSAAVRAVVLHAPASMSEWLKFWAQLSGLSGSEDTLWLRSGRRLEGILRWPLQERDNPQLESDGNVLSLAWEEIDALAVSPALIGPVPEKTDGLTLGLKDGSLLQVRALSTASDNRLSIKLDGDLSLLSYDKRSGLLAAIHYLQKYNPETYLSDRSPASYKHLPESTLRWQLGENRDLYQRPLISGDGTVEKGLAMHSTSQAAYAWDGSPGRFLAEVRFAVPPTGADERLGSATCQVLLAKDGQLQPAGQASISRYDDRQPTSAIFDIDLTDAQFIVLITGAADRGQLGDHVLWLDARVTRP